ncbi:hypothetical protein AVEN_85943-1 [Araneus ventricosus]|uniref:Uncharacterized protein n=1 Tax=Araneus ventricosus TaxID=182803 RepID=A0A4Y2NS94_ARAVE|nr:hypothetical protein AVEN_85943-1 [Araneus ventricosus]
MPLNIKWPWTAGTGRHFPGFPSRCTCPKRNNHWPYLSGYHSEATSSYVQRGIGRRFCFSEILETIVNECLEEEDTSRLEWPSSFPI